jgi:DNA invertase Pin-like site-specific DNA recombinase
MILTGGACPTVTVFAETVHFFAAPAETERDNIREGTVEGLDAAAMQGRH